MKKDIPQRKFIHIFAILIFLTISGRAISQDLQPDVTRYHLTIEPNIAERSVKGSVVINFLVSNDQDSVTFSCGNLEISRVSGDHVEGFNTTHHNLTIYLSERDREQNEIVVEYQGHPKKGLTFDQEHNEAYTSYFTSDWMVCNDAPGDKALFYLHITIPNDKTCIASGELVNKVRQHDKTLFSFQLNTASPAYTYGFAIGDYNEAEENYGDVSLKYYSQDYTPDQLRDVFRETPDIISFFEEKSGIKYFQSVYSQILTGKHYQEMSGYSLLKNTYGEMVLSDSTETNLISHELAHQWWGNQITCKNWNHFWLNEGMGTFMSAAYNEHRFGKQVYLANIESYQNVYEEIKNRGNDRSLVFEDWLNPSKDDRNLVYFKSAYILHLLKEKLGDEVFWKAIRHYSTQYFGKSVVTTDFRKAMEASSGVDLNDFFNEWVYKCQ